MIPKLTVTLPVYNGMPYVVKAVESILNQSYKDFKFLVINDGSRDATAEYLDSIKDSRFTVIHQNNIGLGSTLNKLCRLADTEYIARMDADDYSMPTRLERQVEYLDSNPNVVMVGTGVYFFTDSGQSSPTRVDLTHNEIFQRLRKAGPGVCHPSVMFRRSAFESIGGYRIGGAGEDIDFCLRMGEYGLLGNVQEALFGYRIDNISLSQQKREELHLGYSYAIDCSIRREKGLTEIDFLDFKERWGRRSFREKFFEAVSDLSEKLYRKSITHRISGDFILSSFELGGAAALRPRLALNRFLKK